MIRFLLLAQAGWPSKHWGDIGAPDASDREIMAWAKNHQHGGFTNDLDFGAILSASGGDAPSVVQLRCENTHPSAMLDVVTRSIHACLEELENGCLLTIDPKRSRIRILPLQRPDTGL